MDVEKYVVTLLRILECKGLPVYTRFFFIFLRILKTYFSRKICHNIVGHISPDCKRKFPTTRFGILLYGHMVWNTSIDVSLFHDMYHFCGWLNIISWDTELKNAVVHGTKQSIQILPKGQHVIATILAIKLNQTLHKTGLVLQNCVFSQTFYPNPKTFTRIYSSYPWHFATWWDVIFKLAQAILMEVLVHKLDNASL